MPPPLADPLPEPVDPGVCALGFSVRDASAGSTMSGGQPARIRVSVDFSAGLTERRHRYFTPIQYLAYVHRPRAGSHSVGSRSDFDRLDEAETATREWA